MTMTTLTTCVEDGSVDGMALLTGRHPDEPLTVVTLGLRAAWLHMAVTGQGAAMLTSRDRDALALTATSAYGVPADAIVRYLRRGGASPAAALACVRRLVIEGYLSSSPSDVVLEDAVVDLPVEDRAWIAATALRILGGGSHGPRLSGPYDPAGPTAPGPAGLA